jgi:predicted nucleic acid-binding protein
MFWDSSAVVPSLLREARSRVMTELLRSDTAPALWWASPVECQSALYRRRRDKSLTELELATGLGRLQRLTEHVDVIAPTVKLRDRAGRLLAAHALSAADSLQLAAALAWCEEEPRGSGFVCLDTRLREVARREGFAVLPA